MREWDWMAPEISSVSALTIHAPAKLNLFLAVTGRRPDGFHNLVSVVVPLDLSDRLTVTMAEPTASGGPRFQLVCGDPDVPCDETNLVLRAANAFAKATGWDGGAAFALEKRVPVGAGLGGGSSDGAAALRALNQLAGKPLQLDEIARLATSLGSDCPLFLHERPVVMRGRGEQVQPLTDAAVARLRGRSVIVFKPAFPVGTAWAYQRLAENAVAGRPAYLSETEAENRLAAWLDSGDASAESLLFNNMEPAVFAKHLALPTLLDQLRHDFALEPRMTGSGSACFAFVALDSPVAEIAAAIRAAWGDSAFFVAARLV